MKTAKNRKLHGSVLFTVVFVMSILIVFLFGTLALANAAHNRAHVNYSSAQTKITARTVAESAIKAIGDKSTNGKAYAQAVATLGQASNPGPLSVNVSLTGNGLPGGSDPKLGTMGHISPVTIEYAGKRKYYDAEKGWVDRDLLKFTATVTQNGVESTTSVYAMKFSENAPPTRNGNGGAGFVTVSGSDLTCQTSLYGGSYINLPIWDLDITDGKYAPDCASELEFYEKLSSYSHAKKGSIGGTSIFPGPEDEKFYVENSGAVFEADIMIYNNFDPWNIDCIRFPDAGKGITVFGDLVYSTSNGDKLVFQAGPNLDKYYKDTGSGLADINFNKIPYIYVNGSITEVNNGTTKKIILGKKSSSIPLNVFCGNINVPNFTNEFTIAADLFCMDSDATNKMNNFNNSVDVSALYGWIGSVINNSEPVSTKTDRRTSTGVYVKGNLELSGNCHIWGDLRVQKNLTIASGANVTVEGDMACGGTLKEDGNLTVRGRRFTASGTGGGIVELDNLRGRWYQWAIMDHPGDAGTYTDIYGNRIVITDDEVQIDNVGTFKKDEFTNGDLNLFYALKPDVPGSALLDEVRDSIIAGPYTWGSPNRKYTPDNDWEVFVVTGVVGVDPATASIDELNAARRMTSNQITDQPKFYVSTGDNYNIAQFKTLHNNNDIYPDYAERGVVLGLQQAKDPSGALIPTTQTQIVKTLRDIESEISDRNPHNMTLLKNDKLRGLYTEASSLVITAANRDSIIDRSDTKIYQVSLPGGKQVAAQVEKGPVTITKPDAGSKRSGTDGLLIAQSCTLDLGSVDYPIIVDANGNGSDNICVIIKNVNMNNKDNSSFIIDDTDGGTAYIYIEADGQLTSKGDDHIPIGSLKYANFMYTSEAENVKISSSSDTPGIDLVERLGIPGAVICGGPRSKLYIENCAIVYANIVSPDLDVELRAGGDPKIKIKNFYYNNVDIMHQTPAPAKNFLFGCLNANRTDIPNQTNVIHTPDDNTPAEEVVTPELEYDYWIMYYTDF